MTQTVYQHTFPNGLTLLRARLLKLRVPVGDRSTDFMRMIFLQVVNSVAYVHCLQPFQVFAAPVNKGCSDNGARRGIQQEFP